MSTNPSEIARLRQQIEAEEEAMRRGLTGSATVASHESITARMMGGAERILHLIAQNRHTEAQALFNTDWWEDTERCAPQPPQR